MSDAQPFDELHQAALWRIEIDHDELRTIFLRHFRGVADRRDNMSLVLRCEFPQRGPDRDDQRVVIFDEQEVAWRTFPYGRVAGLGHNGCGCER